MPFSRFSYSPLFWIPPEVAHWLVIFGLKHGLFPEVREQMPECLSIQVCHLRLRTPIGLAAGFDKNAEAIKPLMAMGFGFVEAGTVTKKPQAGNKRPRLFRVVDQKAIVNCLGFNNKGIRRLIKKIDNKELNNLVFGVNLGINKTCTDPPSEYAELVRSVYGLSSYITINVSSPNTAGLRDLQNRARLAEVLSSVRDARRSADQAESVPIFLKIAPDISDELKQDIADEVVQHKINGLIVSNTTTDLGLLGSERSVSITHGGLSGRPLFDLSTVVLSEMYSLLRDKVVLIGCGGVSSGAQALQKIKAGASLVQLYTALVYEGFGVVKKINIELAELLTQEGFSKVEQAVGADVQ
ncbi:quinone-dependent dihydroorotate dehydrogenase [Anaplasma capra]|uniref:quinone-dependent dihydroorotate dehydrogenase n=1 Tax=Anaplasma capra TaxID=1562740 RepID=UPI0021D5D630|nr:quinone-dependent dihydroorotate dehydrogenase [Anaplasma capra]MCU7611342.1 quinone-dependent dihydroorotate dehydrogenase [Anaplasma capra]MCU7612416.1 quinone-dependent dihydroorotate dehydrogenase [Anaplasma capra]